MASMILAENQNSSDKLQSAIKKEYKSENLVTQKVDTNVFTIVNESKNKLIGVIGFSDRWWFGPASSKTGISMKAKSCLEAVAALITMNCIKSVYQIVVDGKEWTIYREEHDEFGSDDEVISFGRQLASRWLEAKEVRVNKKMVPDNWINILSLNLRATNNNPSAVIH
ncbi:hypothetical protein NIES4071_101910 (plasmid) [Calothrix sp. NIES-4071]|nr:hypothetical protein NIES4071_101910 [Calothrix sp. NIES-4071]BAZ64572.1 hypothetical protein NIES4105_103050 [Calothrix sp. NIES-4105]